MEPIRLLHFGDTHIGVENYGRLDTLTGLHTRLQDFTRSLTFAVDAAFERDVDAVLFAGDAYKHATPNPTHEGILATQLKRLADAGIPVIMVTGNHDLPTAFGKASALSIFRTLGGAERFWVAEKPELFRLPTKRGALQVACLPWPTRHILLTKEEYKLHTEAEITQTIEAKCQNVIAKFARDLDPALPSVLLAHVAVADASYSGTERTTVIGQDPILLRSVLTNPAFDYVALGHIHKHQNLNPRGAPPVVYCGSLERIDFGEARDPKGCCFVSLVKGQTSYEYLDAPARRFVKIEVDARDADFPTEKILNAVQQVDVQDAVVRVTYLLREAQQDDVDPERIYAALGQAFLVAGVGPHIEEMRTQRVRLTEGLSFTETLTQYLDFRPDLAEDKPDLLAYAELLRRELDM